MKAKQSGRTVMQSSKMRICRLHFEDSQEDQALYAALATSSDRECRTPLSRQIKHLLAMAMGLRESDLCFLKRLGFSSIAHHDSSANTMRSFVPSPHAKARQLRLILGGAETKREDTTPRSRK
jgi:hypothetical protein